jgi:hypothetical protein
MFNFEHNNHKNSICIKETAISEMRNNIKSIFSDFNDNLLFWTTFDDIKTTLFMVSLNFKDYSQNGRKILCKKKLNEFHGNNKFSYDL